MSALASLMNYADKGLLQTCIAYSFVDLMNTLVYLYVCTGGLTKPEGCGEVSLYCYCMYIAIAGSAMSPLFITEAAKEDDALLLGVGASACTNS